MKRFSGQSAIVTGAAQGMGLAIATQLAQEGARVVLGDINGEAAETTAARLRSGGMEAIASVVDVTREDEVERMVDFAVERHGGLQLLVNNAGILRSTAAEAISGSEWDLVVDVNLKGAFLCSRTAFPHLAAAEWGSIVNLASMAGRATSTLGGVHYTAAKAGLLGLSRHLAREWAKQGINCNAVCPGIVDTPMIRSQAGAERLEAVRESIPFGRFADPSEVAGLVCFLLSTEARYITGASVDIHGGEIIIQ